jgi:hypothetical protein
MEIILLRLNDALPPPCDGPAPSNGAGIRAIGAAITAADILPGAGGKSKIIVSLNNNINTAVNGVIVPLPPTHN